MSEADSLEQILESEIDDKERLDILIYLIERTGEPEKFAQYKSEAEPLANLLQDQEAAIKIKYNEGKIWMQNQENARGMGLIQEALLEAEEIKDSILMSQMHYTIGAFYFWSEELDNAHKSMLRSVETYPTYGDSLRLATNYMALGVVSQNVITKEDALNYQLIALEIKERINAVDALPISYNNAAETYFELGMITEANNLVEKAIHLSDSIQQLSSLYYAIFLKGEFLYKQEKYRLAIPHLAEATQYWEDNESTKDLPRVYKHLYQAYKEAEDFENALLTLEKSNVVRDTLFNIEKISAAADIEAKYEGVKKDMEILREKEEKEWAIKENELTKSQENLRLTIFIVICVVLLVNILYLYRRYKSQRKDKELIQLQKQQIEIRSEEIQDSINYAKRIQSAILPSKSLISEELEEAFVLYLPKDVVAGDFYWLHPTKKGVLFAAADCTGHGVPGALVSVICNNALNRSVREFNLDKPSDILDKTRELVLSEFDKSEDQVKDGMDIALCSIEENKLHYSGAHNPLWILRDGEFMEIKGDKQPIGKFEMAKPFTNHSLDLKKGDQIYVFTDGFVDQFGGEKGKKFKAKSLREFLKTIGHKSIADQKTELINIFHQWKGDLEQVDDVCVIGVRV